MMDRIKNMDLSNLIIDQLKTVYDPEIPVNVYDMGLIYDISVDGDKVAHILMTLTAPNCPVAETLPEEVREAAMRVDGIKDAEVKITFDPPWDRFMMSDEAMLELGLL